MDHGHEAQRNGLIALSLVAGALFLIAVFVIGNGYFRQVEFEAKYQMYYSVPNPELEQLRTREETQLNSYAWIDQEQGRVRIPVERAMELVVQEYAERQGAGGR